MRIQSPSISKTEMAVDCKRVLGVFFGRLCFSKRGRLQKKSIFILDVSVKWST